MNPRPEGSEEKPVRPIEVSAGGEQSSSAAAAADPEEEMHDDDGIQSGARLPMKVQDPKLPTPEEVKEHALTHLPYRAWCPHCVRGKGKSMQRRQSKDKPGIREIHVDYCFMGKAEDHRPKCIVVAKDRETRMVMASVVPLKGASHEFPARRIRAFVNELGCEHVDIIIKSDQEPAIIDLVREVARLRAPANTLKEESPVGASASNGVVERGIQTCEGQIRVLKDALEARIRDKVKSDHPVLTWLVEFAAVLVNRYEVGHDGKTPFERSRGKKSKMLGLEFGEMLNFRRNRAPGRLAKLDCQWEDGIFLGYRTTSGETIVGTTEGVFRTRTVQRKAEEQRWSERNLEMVGGVPWKTSPEQDSGEEVMPAIDMPMECQEDMARPDETESDYVPRRLYIRKGDLDKYGMTSGCKGCLAALRGLRGTAHSEECRRRIMKEMGTSEEGRGRLNEAKARIEDHSAQAMKRARTELAEAGGESARVNHGSSAAAASSGASGSGAGAAKRGQDEAAEGDGWEELAAKITRRGLERETRESGLEEMEVEVIECLQVACEELAAQHEFWDSRTGEPLEGEKVIAARNEELGELERRVYETADVTECWEKTGKAPIGVRWVDVHKGGGVYRSRLVAKDFRVKNGGSDAETLYAAMPPLELVKLLFVEAVATGKKIMLVDIGKAHLYAPVEGEVYVDLPPEKHQDGKCAKLKYTLYGMRAAASNWEKEYSGTLEEIGFRVGRASTCTFWHPEWKVSIVVHGDDFVMAGSEEKLRKVESALRNKYPVKMRGLLGPDAKDDKEAEILNRKVFWTEGRIEFEADAKHVAQILQDMDMEDCNSGVLPGSQKEGEGGDESETLGREDAWRYRSVVARANYLAQDRPDIRYSVKELCRKMSNPNADDWKALKKLCRYLQGRPQVRQKTGENEGLPGVLDVYVDSDWAGCRETRKSTNGGVMVYRGVAVRVWSSTQTVVARNSGEAEYYAAVKGASEAIGFQSVCHDLGVSLKIRVLTDSSACRGICNRTGVGRVKHMAVQLLWLQDVARKGAIEIARVRGPANPADLMTKFLTRTTIDAHMKCLGFV